MPPSMQKSMVPKFAHVSLRFLSLNVRAPCATGLSVHDVPLLAFPDGRDVLF